MTPSRMGALIAVFLSGFPDEASGEPPPAGVPKLPPPTPAPAPRRAGQGKVELTSVRLDPRDGVAHEPEPVLTEATLRADERCREGEPARPRATTPEPPKMQQFQPARVMIRWTRGPAPAVLFEQSSTELRVVDCLRAPPRRHTPVHRETPARR
jgi:hypothetical protein